VRESRRGAADPCGTPWAVPPRHPGAAAGHGLGRALRLLHSRDFPLALGDVLHPDGLREQAGISPPRSPQDPLPAPPESATSRGGRHCAGRPSSCGEGDEAAGAFVAGATRGVTSTPPPRPAEHDGPIGMSFPLHFKLASMTQASLHHVQAFQGCCQPPTPRHPGTTAQGGRAPQWPSALPADARGLGNPAVPAAGWTGASGPEVGVTGRSARIQPPRQGRLN